MPTLFITGANRGLGLQLVKQYAEEGWLVLAGCRKPEQATALTQLSKSYTNIKVFPLDVTSQEQIAHIAKNLWDTPIDVLIHNAGVYSEESSLDKIIVDRMLRAYSVNTLAPLLITRALVENVARSKLKKIIYISTAMSSIAENTSGGSYAYRASKTAGNAMMKNLSIELKPKGIQVLMFHPGWVKTDMGGPNALITPEESVSKIRKIIANTENDKTGVFYAYDGREIAW